MTCTNCQNQIAIHSEFCTHCGTKQDPREAILNSQEQLNETDAIDKFIEKEEAEDYKTSKRKLVIRTATSILFLLAGLIYCIAEGNPLSFVVIMLPLGCWASYAVTYMLGDGMLSFFSKIWSIICAVAAFVFTSIFYGVIMMVVLFVFLVVLSMLGNIATWILGGAAVIGLYSGVVINLIAGIKEYITVKNYQNA